MLLSNFMLWNTEFHLRHHKIPHLNRILMQFNTFQIFTNYVFTIYFNIILSLPVSSKWSSSFTYFDQNVLCIYFLCP